MLHPRQRLLRASLLLAAAGGLSLATQAEARRTPKEPAPLELADRSGDSLRSDALIALNGGDTVMAANLLTELVARQPRDAEGQTLLGLAYHLSADKNPEAISLAMAGYDLASRAEPGGFWPSALAGRAAFDQGRYADALNHFSRAALLRPGDARLMGAVAASAYLSGDAALAQLASDRALSLSAEPTPAQLQLAALSAMAGDDSAAANKALDRLTALAPWDAARLSVRLAQLQQTNALDQNDGGAGVADDAAIGEAPSPDQISLDVAIILSQNTQRARTGFNLLDGLSLQYGVTRGSTRNFDQPNGGPATGQYQRVITTSISVPQLNYNLNLFNRGGQYYSVVARPQLTAYRGEQSEFFIGRSLRVAVGGVNLGSLENIDIGIEMKVTPIEITSEGAKVRIETGRSFLTSDPAGNFTEALTMFRQKVSATAEIRFGETLMLSGLNETVDDRTFSKTPVLGDIPLIGLAFNERNSTQRKDSVMVLVTPSRPIALPGRPWARSDHVARLAELWTRVIDPMSNADAALNRLKSARSFTRMTKSDVVMPFPDARTAAREMIAELATK